MRQILAECKSYHLSIDHERQRLYLTLEGKWADEEEGCQYLAEVRNASTLFYGKFSCLADFSKMQPFGDKEDMEIQEKALKLLQQAGLEKSAQIMPEDNIANDQLLRLSEQLQFPLNLFGDFDVAELYLDSLDQAYV
jgi:hypothetical protein